MRRAGGDVGGDVVVGVDEPVRGGGLVDREPREGLAGVGAEIVRDHLVRGRARVRARGGARARARGCA